MFRTLPLVLSALFVLPSAVLADLTADQTPFQSFRGWWVNRWEYGNSESGIVTMFNRAEQMGITDVMFQVRGQADAYYWNNDGVEARHTSVTPGFDPLGVAIREAQARGMKLHAWINVAPLWMGTSMPSDSNHLVYQTPNPANPDPYYEGWIRDHNRERQPLNSHYVINNLTMDVVHEHINNVVKTISKNYAIDGIHLDYVRYLQNLGLNSTPITYPTDPDTLARYTADTGQTFNPLTDQSDIAKRNAYKQWMANRLTELVTQIRYTTKEHNPASQLTAAVWRNADIGMRDYQQEWERWVQEGILDAAMPMIYRRNFPDSIYQNDTVAAMSHGGSSGVMIGLGTYMQNQDFNTAYDNVMNQLIMARDQGANGIMIYNHGELYNGSAGQNGARQALMDFFAQNSSPPPALSLASFEGGNDTFTWNITVSGSNRNVASGSVERVSGDAAASDWAQQITINKTPGAEQFLARHVSGGGNPANNLELASIGSVGFWLKTTTPDLQVAVALDDHADNSSIERGYFQNIIDDGEWHRYEWLLNDVTHWEAWAGANHDGKVDNRFWLDSIQFIGTEDANVILFDEVFYDAAAVARDQWTFNPAHAALAAHPDAGKWSHPAHWQGEVPNGVGATANLLRRPTADTTITLDQPTTLGTLNINNDSSYTLAGSTITMDNGPEAAGINVINRGNHRISAPLVISSSTDIFVDRGSTLATDGALDIGAGRIMTKTGDGTLQIDGPQNHAAGATIIALRGLVEMNTNAGAGGAALSVAAAGSETAIHFNAPQDLAALNVSDDASVILTGGGSSNVATGTVTLNGGHIELHDNTLAVQTATADTLSDAIKAGRSDPGDIGITSSVAEDHVQLDVGFAPAGDGWLIRATYAGDANLDHTVTIADLGILAANWQQSDRYWFHGDFNYDGQITIADLGILAGNWQAGAAGDSSITFEQALGMFDAFDGVAIPEPAVLSLVALLALTAHRREITRKVCLQ